MDKVSIPEDTARKSPLSNNSSIEIQGVSSDVAKQLVDSYNLPSEYIGVLNNILREINDEELICRKENDQDTSNENIEEKKYSSKSSLNSPDIFTDSVLKNKEAFYISDTRVHIRVATGLVESICMLLKIISVAAADNGMTAATTLLEIKNCVNIYKKCFIRIENDNMCLYLTVIGRFWDRFGFKFSKKDISEEMILGYERDCRIQTKLFDCSYMDDCTKCRISQEKIEGILKSLVDANIFGNDGINYYVKE